MPTPPIPGALADDRYLAFKAVADVIQNNPRLRSLGIRTWAVWDGQATDDDPPTTGKLPWVRITPVYLPCSPLCSLGGGRGLTLAPMEIVVEVAVGGTHIANAMHVWRRIELALTPEDDAALASVQDRISAAGINRIDCIQPGFEVATHGGPFRGDVAGKFRLEQTLKS